MRNADSPNLCIDVRRGSTTDGAAVVHYQCNGGSNQKWYWDANNYIRSALDINKCLIGASGLSAQGTDLIINTCFANDNRFKWVYYTDNSIRPFNKKINSVAVLNQLSFRHENPKFLNLDPCSGLVNMSAVILSVCKCSRVICPEVSKSCIQKKRIPICLDRSLHDRPVFARNIVD